MGIGLFALPAGIISSVMIAEIQKNKECRQVKCPKCGEIIKSDDLE